MNAAGNVMNACINAVFTEHFTAMTRIARMTEKGSLFQALMLLIRVIRVIRG